MKPRTQLHQENAVQALREGSPEAAIGHCLAAEAAMTRSGEAAQIRSLAASAFRLREAPSPEQDQFGHVASLALKAMLSQDVADLDALAQSLMDLEQHALIVDVAACFPQFADDESAAGLPLRLKRATAKALADGCLPSEAASKAALATMPLLDRVLGQDPFNNNIRTLRASQNLLLRRYAAALADLRLLQVTAGAQPFVYVNFCTFLRNLEHPEVRASVNQLVASLQDDPNDLENWYHSLAGMSAMPEAMQVLDRLVPHRPEYGVVRPLRDMADDLDRKPAAVLGRAPTGRHLIYGSIVCWGDKYLRLMEAAALSTLLAPGNIPALCAENDLVIEMVTMNQNLDQILAMPAIQALAAHCQIKIHVFPEVVEQWTGSLGRISYLLYGFGSNLTVQRAARDGADLLFLLPDVIYGDGSMRYVAGLVTSEPLAFMMDGLNTKATPMLEGLAHYQSKTDPSIAIPPPALIDLAASCLMPRTTDFTFDPDAPDVTSYPQRVVFMEEDGLLVYSFSKFPLYVTHAAYTPLCTINYTTIDAQMTDHLLNTLPKKFFHVVDDARNFSLFEIDDKEGRLWARTNEPLIDAIEKLFCNYCFHINSFDLFETGHRYPTKVNFSEKRTTAAQREAFLAELAEARRTRSIFTELGPERAKYGRAAQLSRQA